MFQLKPKILSTLKVRFRAYIAMKHSEWLDITRAYMLLIKLSIHVDRRLSTCMTKIA